MTIYEHLTTCDECKTHLQKGKSGLQWNCNGSIVANAGSYKDYAIAILAGLGLLKEGEDVNGAIRAAANPWTAQYTSRPEDVIEPIGIDWGYAGVLKPPADTLTLQQRALGIRNARYVTGDYNSDVD